MNKEKIKELIPDRLIYFRRCLLLLPKYLETIKNSNNSKIPNVHFYTDEETVDLIINKRMSLARFGDGEFMWMNGISHMSFQDYSRDLDEDLIKAFNNKNKNLLIGIPKGIFDNSKFNIYAKMHWRIIRENFIRYSLNLLDINKTYVDASITRPYIDYKSKSNSKKLFNNLKRIWDDKDIVIVEGKDSKLGLGNDLFSNTKSIKRIICPSRNAYSYIKEIKNEIVKNVDKNTLILGALGPTASILASELCDLGYQFVDIGHIDIEYMWYLKGSILKEQVKGKYVNESGSNFVENMYDSDTEYLNSIIVTIK